MTTTLHPMLTVGERLSIARNRAHMKVGTMATVLGRHRNMVTAYESSNDVPLWVIRTYAEVLPNHTTVEWLTAEVGEPPSDTHLEPPADGQLIARYAAAA